LRDGKTISKILSGLSHSGGDRAPSFHDRERVDKTIGAGRTAGSVADCPFKALDDAVIGPLQRWHDICNFRGWRPIPNTLLRHWLSEQNMNDAVKKFRERPAPAVSGTVE
jgi:hypothetical protein